MEPHSFWSNIKSSFAIAFLLLLCQFAHGTTTMGISHVGGLDIPFEYNAVGMQGDSLALFNFQIVNRTININRGMVTPLGAIIQPQIVFSYEVNPEWGVITADPLFFAYKNDKLYSAFLTDITIIVCFTGVSGTDTHIINRAGIDVFGNFNYAVTTFYIANESTGYLSNNGFSPNWGNRIYRMDFATNTLVLFYEDPLYMNIDTYLYQSFNDEYILMYTCYTDGADLLVQDDAIIQEIAGGWHSIPYLYVYTQKAFDNGYFTMLSDLYAYETSMFAWIENNELHRTVVSFGTDTLPADEYRCIVPLSDSTFSCIRYSIMHSMLAFKHYQFSDNHIVEIPLFPDLSAYPNGMGLIKMDQDYTIAVAGISGTPETYILVDYTDQSIRAYPFNIDYYTYYDVKYYNSDRYLYKLSWDGRVHIFHMQQMTAVSDENTSPTITAINTYPNPFADACSIEINSTKQTIAKIEVYNLKGQKIKSLHNGRLNEGTNPFTWNGKNDENKSVASGIYIIKLEANGITSNQKTVLIK